MCVCVSVHVWLTQLLLVFVQVPSLLSDRCVPVVPLSGGQKGRIHSHASPQLIFSLQLEKSAVHSLSS